MKKIIKPAIVVLALTLVSSTLFGFTAVASNDTPTQNAVWTTEGTRDSITYQNVEYKRIDADISVMPLNCRDYNIEDGLVTITEADDTSLFFKRDRFCAALSFDRNFITTDIDNDEITYRELITASADDATMEVFCKADIYDDIMEEINAGIEYTDYGYAHPVHNEELGITENQFYLFSDEENETFKKILTEVNPVKNNDAIYEFNWILSMDEISDNHLFTSDSYNIYQDCNGTYYLVNQTTNMQYEVPEDMNETFDKVVEDYLANTAIYAEKRSITSVTN